MTSRDDSGAATAEHCVGTLGAVLIATVLIRLGVLDDHNPWRDAFTDILEHALGWGRLGDLLPGSVWPG